MQETNDNFSLRGPKLLDERSGKELAGITVPFDSVAEANSSILEAYRCEGLTVLISDGVSNVEYWWKDGIADGDLVEKGTSNTVDIIVVSSISSLENYSGGATTAIFKNDIQGGVFNYSTDALSIDGGNIFEAIGKGTGYWVRMDANILNDIRHFGATTALSASANTIILQDMIASGIKNIYIPEGVDYEADTLTNNEYDGLFMYDANVQGLIFGKAGSIRNSASTDSHITVKSQKPDNVCGIWIQNNGTYPFTPDVTGTYNTLKLIFEDSDAEQNSGELKYSDFTMTLQEDSFNGYGGVRLNTKSNGNFQGDFVPIEFVFQNSNYKAMTVANLQAQVANDGPTQFWKFGGRSKAFWYSGRPTTAGEYIVIYFRIYKATTTGTTGSTLPTHTSGTVSDGGVSWQYLTDTSSAGGGGLHRPAVIFGDFGSAADEPAIGFPTVAVQFAEDAMFLSNQKLRFANGLKTEADSYISRLNQTSLGLSMYADSTHYLSVSTSRVIPTGIPYVNGQVTKTSLDTTLAISSANQFSFADASATNFTAFTGGISGQIIYVVFTTANTTLVESGSLFLNGTGNITPAMDEVYSFLIGTSSQARLIGVSKNGVVQLQSSTPGTAQTGNLNISGKGIFGGGIKITGNINLTTGSDATGDMYYRNPSADLNRLAIGSSGQILTTNGTTPNWFTPDITLAIGSSGTAPAWLSSSLALGGTATLNIPLAGAGITSGTISATTQTIAGVKTFSSTTIFSGNLFVETTTYLGSSTSNNANLTVGSRDSMVDFSARTEGMFGGATTVLYGRIFNAASSLTSYAIPAANSSYATLNLSTAKITLPTGTTFGLATAVIKPPTITTGGQTLNRSATLWITGAPTGGTANDAFYVEEGTTYLVGNTGIGVTSATTSFLTLAPSTTAKSSLNLGSSGTAPTSPVDGDVWATSAHLFTRLNGVTYQLDQQGGGGGGTVTTISITTANGISGSVSNPTTTPAITLTLGAITPTTIVASSTISGSNLSGTNTGDQTTITGNAGSATILQTARTINGTSFDGSGNITVTAAAGTLTGATLASGVTASSLTSFGSSPTLITPILGTPTSGTLTNATGLPISTGVSGLGSGVAAFLATPSSENLSTALTTKTGTGLVVFATSPALTTPSLGVATATSINKVTITTPATGSTLTIVDGGSLITAGAFSTTLTSTATTAITLPVTGTLATLAGTEILTNKTIGVTQLNGSAYTIAANNTGSTANYTEFTYKYVAPTTYSDTVTFTAGAAPTGANNLYAYEQFGKKVTVWLWLNYTNAGTTVTVAQCPFPSGLPLPEEPTGFTGTNDFEYPGIGYFAPATTSGNPSNFGCNIVKTGTGAYGIHIKSSSAASKIGYAQITYICV